MRTSFLPALAIVLPSLSSAQLAPQAPAPLIQHLVEVNKEWRTMDPTPAGGDRIAAFENDAQRITLHLHRVASYLRAHSPEGLSAASSGQRTMLLDALDAYADRGRFPLNHVLPYRNPLFIDPHGTACAVGQLMIESGDAPLADRIHDEMNLAYVHDMHRTDVDSWAVAHGFTEDELAWIQPAYAPQNDWLPLGGGTDSSVTALYADQLGGLVACGRFTQAGTTPATRVARWVGNAYDAYGTGVDGLVDCAIEHNGSLYLGGQFLNGMYDLAMWNGSYWSYDLVFPGMSPMITDLCVHDGGLYASGSASGFAGTDDNVRHLTSNGWELMGGLYAQFNAPVFCLASHNGQLIAGGAFTGFETMGGPPVEANFVAELDSLGWHQVGDGLNGAVRDLLVMNDTLYAGGELYANVAITFGLASIAPGASTWEHLLPGHASYIPVNLGPTFIETLAEVNGTLYFGGSFEIQPMLGTFGRHVARYYGMPDAVIPLGYPDQPVHALAAWNNSLIIGGDFSTNVGDPMPYLAYFDLTSGIDPPSPSSDDLSVWPVPADDVLALDLGDMPFADLHLSVIDASGRVVMDDIKILSSRQDLDVSALSPGSYRIRILDGRSTRSLPFVKR